MDGLRARLDAEPDDAGGWLLLARSYDHLGRNARQSMLTNVRRALGKTDVEFESKLLGKSLTNNLWSHSRQVRHFAAVSN